MNLYIGIDVGTSACRACAIDARREPVAVASQPLPAPTRRGAAVEQDPLRWWGAFERTLDALCTQIDAARVTRIAIDATSSTLLLCTRDGRPLTPALMYNDSRARAEAARIAALAPPDHAATGAGSSLAKLLYLAARQRNGDWLALHQADWLAGRLTGGYGFSDENNALKLGYDAVQRRWPAWLDRLSLPPGSLPRVREPGTPLGAPLPRWRQRWGFPSQAVVVAGTTDSTAAFIATGVQEPGAAVTSLGSTLVLKVLCEQPIGDAAHGVYSHRLGELWLAGGASNSGGAVLRRFFSDDQLAALSPRIRAARASCLDYYPLPAPGERFPVNDPERAPRLSPRPRDDVRFLHGLLEGMARIEQRGYRLLAERGAPYPSRVVSVGGGAVNEQWRQIRQRRLGVAVQRARHQQAAYGAALLAHSGVAGYRRGE